MPLIHSDWTRPRIEDNTKGIENTHSSLESAFPRALKHQRELVITEKSGGKELMQTMVEADRASRKG